MIEATGLHKRYGATVAVHDLSFEVRPGRVTGFLGPNGAGKSTTIRLMLDLDAGGGRTLYGGRPYRELRHPTREVGTLLDAKAFHPTRKARNHLRMLAAATGVPDARVDEVLAMVGLESVAKKQPQGFSLGMGQRLGLAAALLGDPHTLILDEPANGLDPQGINWLRGFLQDFAASGRSVFVSSHLLAEMALMADHLVVIGKGRTIANESVADFVANSSRSAVLVQSPRIDELATLLRAEGAGVERVDNTAIAVSGADRASVGELAYAHQIVLHELTDRAATLEEAFLEATTEAEQFVATAATPRPKRATADGAPEHPEHAEHAEHPAHLERTR
ncbi:ABC transporter ATP-binding protein [Streptomyces sp. MB09-02B]|uniref:ABC transporter ATP-binding protein n=1 Tax=Streptomyces sp. MB09-02B TaxID=3028667 RepID=UPI0029BF8A56|nr:ATP-binding cassette domain-containing protein [Streptomyces sp. MB09-02B]MDX3642491.1 ATP-binding cassette domain-containing protein [Streptomyces sp. MB09-02B]